MKCLKNYPNILFVEQVGKNRTFGIQDLCDDIIIMIFQLLNIPDKIKLERVCSQWRILLQRSWTRFSCLDLSVQKWSTERPMYYVKNGFVSWGQFDETKLKSVITRCYLYLASIDFTADKSFVNKAFGNYAFKCSESCVLDIIGSSCVNLKIIRTKICCTKGLKCLANRIKTLESIFFMCLQNYDCAEVDRILNELIQNNRNITSIRLNKVKSLRFVENAEHEFQEIDFFCVVNFVGDFENILVNLIKKSTRSLKKISIKTYRLNLNKISYALQSCSCLSKINIDVEKFVNTDINMCLSKILSQSRNIKCLTIKPLSGESNIQVNQMHWLHCIDPTIFTKLDLAGSSYKLNNFPVLINLQSLSLKGVTSDNDAKTCESLGMCVNLMKLRMIKCNLSLKTSCNEYILKNFCKLKYLFIDRNKNSDLNENDLIKYVSANLHNLEQLVLGLNRLTDDGLKYLSNLKKLFSLSIYFSERITGNNLFRIRTLKEFECFFCENLKDESVNLLIDKVNKLKKLRIYHCSSITENIINYAIEKKSAQISNQELLTISASIDNTKANDYERKYNKLELSLPDDFETISLSEYYV